MTTQCSRRTRPKRRLDHTAVTIIESRRKIDYGTRIGKKPRRIAQGTGIGGGGGNPGKPGGAGGAGNDSVWQPVAIKLAVVMIITTRILRYVFMIIHPSSSA